MSRRAPRRLGVYYDSRFRAVETPDGRRVVVHRSDRAFLLFVDQVASSFDSLTLFGRTDVGDDTTGHLELPGPARVVELPAYPDLRHLGRVIRAMGGTFAAFWRGLRHVDVVWILGPHPFAPVMIVLALLARTRVVLGVRQDTIPYFRSRMPDQRWAATMVLAHLLDRSYKALGRWLPVTVVGETLAAAYEGRGRRVLPMIVSLVPAEHVASAPRPPGDGSTVELVTVGRLEPEKNPELLLAAMARLHADEPGRYRLRWVGTGFQADAVAARVVELGLEEVVELVGFLPFGPDLLDRYRRADVFVHVSLTEGIPQVLVEAMACATPVVATDVGGVGEAVGDAAVLVPPRDLDALVGAVRRLADDPARRVELAERGLERVGDLTLEAQAEAVARFLGSS